MKKNQLGIAEILATILFAIILIPTKYTYIHEKYFPDFISPILIMEGITCFLIIYDLVKNKPGFPKIPHRLWASYTGLLLTIMISLFFTPNIGYGIEKAVEFVTITTLACYAPIFLFRKKENIQIFIFTILAIGILSSIFIIVEKPYSYSIQFNTKLGSNYLAIEHTAGMAALTILYFIFLKVRPILRNAIWIFLLFILMTGLLYPGGKGPVLSFYLTVLLIFIFSIEYKPRFKFSLLNRRILIAAVLAMTVGTSVIYVLSLPSNIQEKVQLNEHKDSILEGSALILRTKLLLTEGHYANVERIENAIIALKLFLQNPLKGVGIGGFSTHAYEKEGIERFKYPHNIILEILCELGLIGFLLFSIIGIFVFKNLYILHRRKEYLGTLFLSLILFTFLNSMTSQHIANPALFAFIGGSFAIKELNKIDFKKPIIANEFILKG